MPEIDFDALEMLPADEEQANYTPPEKCTYTCAVTCQITSIS
jgi:hypothetical protein